MITAAVVNGKLIPRISSADPNNPFRPNAISNAKPATDGGNTIGRSRINSTHDLFLNFQRDKTYASGVPKTAAIIIVIELVTRLKVSAFIAWSESALEKKLGLIERKITAARGITKSPSSNTLGTTNIQFE